MTVAIFNKSIETCLVIIMKQIFENVNININRIFMHSVSSSAFDLFQVLLCLTLSL